MSRLAKLALPGLALLASACDSTFFGDAEPDFNNPFTRGETQALEKGALRNLDSFMASERHPGFFYALGGDIDGAVLHVFDEGGNDQGSLQLSGVTRLDWRDLTLQDGQLLILSVAAGNASLLHFDEPAAPPPYDRSLTLAARTEIVLDSGSPGGCTAVAGPYEGPELTLLCGGRFYNLANDGGNPAMASLDGPFQPSQPSGTVQDFSISPRGGFAIVVGDERSLIAQRQDAGWSAAFTSRVSAIEPGADVPTPTAGSFAYNTVVTYIGGRDSDSGLLFGIFTP